VPVYYVDYRIPVSRRMSLGIARNKEGKLATYIVQYLEEY